MLLNSTKAKMLGIMAQGGARPADGHPWFSIENKDSADVATVRIFDDIGWYAVTAEDFASQLDTITASTIHLRINSRGGDVFDGITIFYALKDHPARIETFIDGQAASIASIIALAGEVVHIQQGAMMMIHKPWTGAVGNAEDLRKTADVLDQVSGILADIYADKTGKPADEIMALMAEETYFTADEAVELGLADDIPGSGESKARAQAKTEKPNQEKTQKESSQPANLRPAAVERMKKRLALAKRAI